MLLCSFSGSAPDRFVHRRNRVVSRLQLKTGRGRQLGIHENINPRTEPTASFALGFSAAASHPQSSDWGRRWGCILCMGVPIFIGLPMSHIGLCLGPWGRAGCCCALLTQQGKHPEPNFPAGIHSVFICKTLLLSEEPIVFYQCILKKKNKLADI